MRDPSFGSRETPSTSARSPSVRSIRLSRSLSSSNLTASSRLPSRRFTVASSATSREPVSSPPRDCSTWCSRSAIAPSRLSSSVRTTRSTLARRLPIISSSSSMRPSSWPSVPSWRDSSERRSVTTRSRPSTLRSTSENVSRCARCSASWATRARLNNSSTRGGPSAKRSGFSGVVIGPKCKRLSRHRRKAYRPGSTEGHLVGLPFGHGDDRGPRRGCRGSPVSAGPGAGHAGRGRRHHRQHRRRRGLPRTPRLPGSRHRHLHAGRGGGPDGLGPGGRHLPHPRCLRPLRRSDVVPARRRRPGHPPLPDQPTPGRGHADRGDGRDHAGLGREGQAPPHVR